MKILKLSQVQGFNANQTDRILTECYETIFNHFYSSKNKQFIERGTTDLPHDPFPKRPTACLWQNSNQCGAPAPPIPVNAIGIAGPKKPFLIGWYWGYKENSGTPVLILNQFDAPMGCKKFNRCLKQASNIIIIKARYHQIKGLYV